MSYTALVKEEVLQKEVTNPKERLMELFAILKSKNAILPGRIDLNIEHSGLAKRVYEYLRKVTDLKILVKYSISKRLGEHRVYSIIIPYQKNYGKFYEMLQKIDNEDFIRNEHKINGFIRGMFLATGYIKDPKKEYDLEFFIEDKGMAEKFYELLKTMEKRTTLKQKGNKYLVYVKNSEDIMDIMVSVGAMKSFFEYEEVTVIKDIKNKTVRSMNWEIANETKTMDTAEKQLDMINYIEEHVGLETITPVLREVAYVRIENPESSLSELAEIIGITKSGIRNRFRRLEQIYRNLES